MFSLDNNTMQRQVVDRSLSHVSGSSKLSRLELSLSIFDMLYFPFKIKEDLQIGPP